MSGSSSQTLAEKQKKMVELRAWKTHDVDDIELQNFMPKEDKELDKTDVKPLLYLVDDILNRAIRNVNRTFMEDEDYMTVKTRGLEVIRTRERFNHKLDKIAYKIAYDISRKADLHYTVLSIFKILRDHRWEDKLILCLTAFALNYGECWHLALKHSSYLLGELMKQASDIHKQPPHHALQEVNDLVRATMDVMKCVIDFQKVQRQLVDEDKHKKAEEANKILDNKISMPVTIYWSIKSVLVCASMITRFITMDLKYSVSDIEMKELNRLTKELENKKQCLQNLKKSLDTKLAEKKAVKTVETIKSLLEFPQVDNMNVLRALLTHDRDPQPLVKDNKKVDLEDLRKQMVLLLISDLGISEEDIEIMKDINSKSRAKTRKQQNQLEILWLPMIDKKGSDDDKKFEEKRNMMKWYTVGEPSLIADQVKEMAKEWNFNKEPIIVVINKQGQVACPDAFPMIRIWGYDAYPFTILMEEALWMDKSCNLELLFSADRPPQIQELIKPGKESKCLYGGEDMEWIQMFTTRAPSVAEAAKAPLHMLYVGTPKPNKRTRRITKTIKSRSEENDQTIKCPLEENDQMKFWKRLENLAHSKMQLGKTIYDDQVLQDIVLIHNLGSSGDGWAVLCCGLDIKIIAKGEKFLHSLVNFSDWKSNVKELESSPKTSTPDEVEEERKESSGFIHALEQHLTMYPYAIDHDKSYKDIFDKKVAGSDILKIFVSDKDNWQPLINGSTKQRVNVDHLKKKKLFLLLISDCSISQEELAPLKRMYTESMKGPGKDESTNEIVWLPIEDPTTSQGNLVVNQKIDDPTTLQQEFKKKQEQEFKKKQEQMPWYSVYELSMINQAATRFVKQFWHYDGRTIVVALNDEGMVQCVQALRKIAIWPQKVIVNPSSTEKAMWTDMEWSLDLIIDDLYPKKKEWVNAGHIICIYGGGDTEFPQKLWNITKTVEILKNTLNMLYVGKCDLSDQFEKLDGTLVQLFWYRLKSMWISKYEMGNMEDNIMKKLSQLLGFDRSGSGWAIMAKGRVVIMAKENDLLDSLLNYENWKKTADANGFLETLEEKLKKIETPCLKFTLPEFAQNKREAVGCWHMQRFFTFKCC